VDGEKPVQAEPDSDLYLLTYLQTACQIGFDDQIELPKVRDDVSCIQLDCSTGILEVLLNLLCCHVTGTPHATRIQGDLPLRR
jgi:hypothetical protein